MLVDAFLSVLPALLSGNLDPAPEPEDVKAGWTAFGLFLGGVAAVALLGWSLVKQLRKVDAAEEAGLYDPSAKKKAPTPPVEGETVETTETTEQPSS